MEEEYELYYILAFEASLMNEGILLERLFSEFNSTALVEIANGSSGNLDNRSLALAISNLTFDHEEIQANDLYTASLICSSSDYLRLGVFTFDRSKDQELIEWFDYRPVYSGRKNYVSNLNFEATKPCGDFGLETLWAQDISSLC